MSPQLIPAGIQKFQISVSRVLGLYSDYVAFPVVLSLPSVYTSIASLLLVYISVYESFCNSVLVFISLQWIRSLSFDNVEYCREYLLNYYMTSLQWVCRRRQYDFTNIRLIDIDYNHNIITYTQITRTIVTLMFHNVSFYLIRIVQFCITSVAYIECWIFIRLL